MFKKANRLAKAKDISMTFARGRAFFNPFFTIKYLPHPALTKFSVVVSNKVFKKANQRNRLKRVLREYLRKNVALFKPGNYLIMTKVKITTLPEPERLDSFLALVKKLR